MRPQDKTGMIMKRFIAIGILQARIYGVLLFCLFTFAGCTVQYTKPDGPGGGYPSSGPQLLDTSWRAVEIQGRKASFFPGQKMDAYIVLNRGGRFSGSTGCNNLNGSYTRYAGRISFGSPGTTRMACSPRIMQQERHFLEALRQTASYEMSARRLSLFDGRGRTVMVLIAAR